MTRPVCFAGLSLLLVASTYPDATHAQWRTSTRLQAGAETDNNIFETTDAATGSFAGKLQFRTQARRAGRKTAISFKAASAFQAYPEFHTENKLITDGEGALRWRASRRVALGLQLKARLKLFLSAPLDYANTWSRAFANVGLPGQFVLGVAAVSSRFDYAESDAFDYTLREIELYIQKQVLPGASVEGAIAAGRARFFRPVYRALGTDGFQPLPDTRQADDQWTARLRFATGRRHILSLEGEFQDDDSNSIGYSYRRYRLSALAGIRLDTRWLLRAAAMLQHKSYRDVLGGSLPTELDVETTQSNFFVADLNYDAAARISYLFRVALYRNEAALRGSFYRKVLVFAGAEYRF